MQNYILFIFSTVLFFSIEVLAFDVGGLVSNDNGGYSDVGFGGIAGSGDLGLSDADLGGGFGVSSGSNSQGVGSSGGGGYGGYGSSGGDGGGNLSGSGGTNSAHGQQSSDQGYNNAVEQAEKAVTDRVDFDHSLSPDQKESVKSELARDQELSSMIDSFGKMASIGLADQESLDAISEHVSGVIGDMISQFNGSFVGNTLDLSSLNIHPNSKNIVKKLTKAFKAGPINDPLSRLGLLGVKVLVMKDLGFSFYSRRSDTIYLSNKDIKKYGVAVFYHELLHAGLEKAKKSGAITVSQYNKLSELNEHKFSHFNGYVGRSRGIYLAGGFGYQEAFVVGWSYVKINSNSLKISEQEDPLVNRALNYKSAILDNVFLNTVSDGKKLNMIHSKKMSRKEVKNQFLNFFSERNSDIRMTITDIQNSVKKELPDLCIPKTTQLVSRQYCMGSREYIPLTRFSEVHKVCGSDYRFKVKKTSCVFQFSGK